MSPVGACSCGAVKLSIINLWVKRPRLLQHMPHWPSHTGHACLDIKYSTMSAGGLHAGCFAGPRHVQRTCHTFRNLSLHQRLTTLPSLRTHHVRQQIRNSAGRTERCRGVSVRCQQSSNGNGNGAKGLSLAFSAHHSDSTSNACWLDTGPNVLLQSFAVSFEQCRLGLQSPRT